MIELHVWTMREGLRGATAGDLFDGYCQRLVASGCALWRAHVSTQTLHPQWGGYGYTWRRELNAVHAQQFVRGSAPQEWLDSPFHAVVSRAYAGEDNPSIRRRLELGRARPITYPRFTPSANAATPRMGPASYTRSRPTAAAVSPMKNCNCCA